MQPTQLYDQAGEPVDLAALFAAGGAATIADGADAAQGAKADAAAATDTGTFSLVALFKRLLQGITTLIAGVKDNGPAWTPVRALKSSADATTASDLTAAPTAGQKVVIDDLWVSVDTAMRVDILEETSGTVLWSAYLPGGGCVQFTPRDGLKLDTADKKARIQTSAAGNLRCIALYHSA